MIWLIRYALRSRARFEQKNLASKFCKFGSFKRRFRTFCQRNGKQYEAGSCAFVSSNEAQWSCMELGSKHFRAFAEFRFQSGDSIKLVVSTGYYSVNTINWMLFGIWWSRAIVVNYWDRLFETLLYWNISLRIFEGKTVVPLFCSPIRTEVL